MENTDLKKLVKLTLGDWSDDGHGKTDTIIYLSNKSVEEIRKAYKASCKKTKIRLDHETAIGINAADFETAQKHSVASEYEDGDLTKFHIDTLTPFGFSVDKVFKGLEYEIDDDGSTYLYPDTMAALFVWFVKLSLPDWAPEEIEIEPINGYWNKQLNIGIGYGLYT